MNHKVHNTIHRYHMLGHGDRVVVGFSGGADSVALLSFLWTHRQSLSITVSAAHLHHHIRGEEGDRDLQFCMQFCKERGIPLTVGHKDILELAKAKGQSVEETAREERYAFFRENCPMGGKIATAHTLSDSMETVLFNMTRGTGLRGLGGIPPVRGNIIRPLIACTRQEIESYCTEEGLAFVVDSTNLSLLYSRNKIRQQIIPLLYELNPHADSAFLRMTASLTEDEAYLTGEAQKALGQAKVGENEYTTALLKELPKPILSRCLKLLLAAQNIPLSAQLIEQLHRMVGGEEKTVEGTQGVYLQTTQGILRVFTKYIPQAYFEQPLRQGKIGLFEGKSMVITRQVYEQCKKSGKIYKDVLKNTIDYARIRGNAVVRQKKEGDRLSVVGRQGSKTLKKLFNETALDVTLRDKVAVIADEQGVLWVEGYGCDKRVAPTEQTQEVLTLNMVEDADEAGYIKGSYF